MQTSAGNRFAGLDHLRALAIIIVFLYHYNMFGHPPGLYEYAGNWGWTGVDLFFVLSGYLIGGQLFAKLSRDQPINYGEFYFKRSLRILPAYLAVLLLYFTIPAFTERSQLPPLWRFLTFTQNFGLDLSKTGAFSHAWSLCIEEQFYLFLPLLIIGLTMIPNGNKKLAKNNFLPPSSQLLSTSAAGLVDGPVSDRSGPGKKAVWIIPGLFLFGFLIRGYIWYDILATPQQTAFGKSYYRLIYYPTWSRLDGLLAGVALAAFYYFKPLAWQRITKKGNLLLLIALGLIAGAWLLTDGDHQYEMQGAIFGYPAIAVAYGALVLAALSPTSLLSNSVRTESVPRHYLSRLTRTIANLSYAIYLTHKQLIHLTHEVLRPHGIGDNTYTCFWISLVVALLGGWLLHILVERPFLRLRDRILSKRPRPENNLASALNSR